MCTFQDSRSSGLSLGPAPLFLSGHAPTPPSNDGGRLRDGSHGHPSCAYKKSGGIRTFSSSGKRDSETFLLSWIGVIVHAMGC